MRVVVHIVQAFAYAENQEDRRQLWRLFFSKKGMTNMKKRTIFRVMKVITLSGLFLSMVGFSAGMFYVNMKLSTLPPIDTVYLNTYGTTKITDKDGNVIYEETDRVAQTATFDELPSLYKDGLVAVEDHEFWHSKGYSIKGMLHALTRARGGSTIEQQLIKNTYYNGGRGYDKITRKIHEVFLAKQMDENISKQDILTYYVNKLELGEGTTGIKAAMRVYFDKSPADFNERTYANIAQLAYLTGLGQAPSAYDLYTGDSGLDRTSVVLGVWFDKGLISEDEYNAAKQFDLKGSLAPRYHYQTTQKEINKEYAEYTSEVLKEIKELGYDTEKATLQIKTYLDKDVYNSIKQTVQSGPYLDNEQEVGVAVIDSEGVVVGLVGGRGESEWNRAIQNTRSSGSSMKPFTAYGPLFQYFGNQYNTASRFDTSNYTYPGTSFVMRNYGGATYGMLDAQQALRWSLNTPVARIDDNILGSGRMKTFLNGLDLDVKDSYSANDGIGLNISPLQSAAAYNAINNGGVYTKPRFVDTITFVDGTSRTIAPRRNQAMNASVAYVLTQMLRGVPKQGIGSASDADIPTFTGYAGKTGSVAFEQGVNNNFRYGQGGSDAWYASITNGGYAITVWTGYDTPNTSPQIPDTYKGQQTIGKNLQLMLNKGRKVENWAKPSTVNLLSGSDLKAHYAVTDAGDITTGVGINVPDFQTFPKVNSVEAQTKADTNWYGKLTQNEKDKYKAYLQKPDDFKDDGILSDNIYKLVTGHKSEER